MARVSWRTAVQIGAGAGMAVAAVVVVALLLRHQSPSASRQAAAAPSRSAPAAPAVAPSAPAPASAAATAASCGAAVAQANLSLSQATAVEKALAEHTAVMSQLLAGHITPQEALNTGMISLIHGAAYSAQFEGAYADYRAVRLRCGLAGQPPGPVPPGACVRAVQAADVSFLPAFGIDVALAAHTQVMDRLLAGQITPVQALNQGEVSLVQGAADAAKFDLAYQAYLRVLQQCQLPTAAGGASPTG